MPDFSQLLSQPVDSFERPKPLPAGTYYGRITTFVIGETKSENKTPFVKLNIVLESAGEDINQDDLVDNAGKPIDLSKRPSSVDFYLTPDASWRIRELMESLDIIVVGRSLNETLPELQGQPVMVSMIQKPSRDGSVLYSNIDKLVPHKS